MEVFIDSANLTEINRWNSMGVIDGVTTNPSIMLKDGVYDIELGARDIASIMNPRPICVEVTTNDLTGMVSQAERFAAWAPNIVVKIPCENQDGFPCYGVINQLEGAGIKVNATAALSLGQAILAAKAGATYISIFAGRIADEGGNPAEVVAHAVAWLTRWNYKSRVIVGSMRSVGDVLTAALAGAHAVTITPPLLARMADHKYARETVRQFMEDAEKSLTLMANPGDDNMPARMIDDTALNGIGQLSSKPKPTS